ncbi:MAG: MoaD/ThiS family protein [Chloroflexi bacterium]|nr:MoaD/ThiS family protein [Chloroflexota bacterium]
MNHYEQREYVSSMKVAVKLFAGLRDRAGIGDISLDLPDGATVSDAIDAAQHSTPIEWTVPTTLMAAVNNEYVEVTEALADGDELALIPPVSGG